MKPDIVPPGSLPPPGVVPRRMYAQTIRQNRYGNPVKAFRMEEIVIPQLKDNEVLFAVMAAGVNYNNVFAAQGYPIDVIGLRTRNGDPFDFHIGGSEASGIVYSIGSNVKNVKIGDEIVIQGGVWDVNDPYILEGGDPLLSQSFRAWGFETNWGSFAQFSVVEDYQCLPKPPGLGWEESSIYLLTGATAYRMLHHWQPNVLKKGDPVLIWGGAGGLGVMAIQLVREAGGIPVAVVGSDDKIPLCHDLGASGVINRNQYHHWGLFPGNDIKSGEYAAWRSEVSRFNKEVLSFTGGIAPSIVLEHPGELTLPTSLFVCRPGGMVVTCGGTTGYTGSFDLRYLWMKQKRVQGSHFASLDECESVNRLIMEGRIRPVLSEVVSFSEVGECHQRMLNNSHPPGKMAIRIGAPT